MYLKSNSYMLEILCTKTWEGRVHGVKVNRVRAFTEQSVLKLAYTGSWEPVVHISSQHCSGVWWVQESLKTAIVTVFSPQKMVNTTNQDFFLGDPVVKYLPTQCRMGWRGMRLQMYGHYFIGSVKSWETSMVTEFGEDDQISDLEK